MNFLHVVPIYLTLIFAIAEYVRYLRYDVEYVPILKISGNTQLGRYSDLRNVVSVSSTRAPLVRPGQPRRCEIPAGRREERRIRKTLEDHACRSGSSARGVLGEYAWP